MRVIKILAILMIYLIISLTFFTAFVFATIYRAEIIGQDNVPGSIRSSDNVRIRTESTMPCSVIGQSFNLTEYTAMTCTGGAPIVCTYSKSLRDQYDSVSAIVRESGSEMTQQAYAYPDLLGPAFISLSMLSLGNSVRASYSVRDFGNEFHQEKCSGIEKVEFLINNQVVNTTEYPVGSCDVTGIITGSKANFIGNVNTSVKIYDHMGYTANRTGGEVFIDTVPPVIQTSVKAYRPGTDEQITSAVVNSTVTRTIEVRITVDDNAIPPNGGATADFSMFDSTGSTDQSNVEAVCERIGWENSYTCSFPGVRLNPSKLSLQFPVNVSDTLGNTAGKVLSITFTAHTGANIASSGKVFVSGSTEDEVKKISTNSTRARTADAFVTITGSAPIISTSGNFQELSRTSGSSQTNVPGECFLSEEESSTNTYGCWFYGITLNPNKTSPKAAITATDELGKQVTKNISFSFTNVPSAGTVNKLGPDPSHCQGNICYLKEGLNTVIATLSTQSTFFDNQLNINGVRAFCQQGNGWNCTADVTVGTSETTLDLQGTDDFGNVMTYQSSIVVDGVAPERRGEINITPSCPTSGDNLRIIMNVTEAKSPEVTISAITSEISSNNVTTSKCTRVGQTSQWKCALSVNNIIEQEIESATLNVIVEDLAGNQLVEEVPVSVCINVDEVPDLIEEVKVVGRLPRIDRKTAKAIVLKLPIGLEIVPSGDMQIISRSNVKCPETPCLSGTPYMVNDAELTPTMILPIRWTESCQETLDETDSPDNIQVTCSQEFKIRSGNRIYSYPEQENFTFSLEMYNQIGLNSTYKTKINEIKKEIQRIDAKLKEGEKVHKFLGKICKTAEGLGKANAALATAKSVLWAAAIILPFLQPAFKAVDKVSSKFQQIVDTYVWPQGWVPMPPKTVPGETIPPEWPGNNIGLAIKGMCAIYTCKFYDFNTYVDIWFSWSAYSEVSKDLKRARDEEAKASSVKFSLAQGEPGLFDLSIEGKLYQDSGGIYKLDGYNKVYVSGPNEGQIVFSSPTTTHIPVVTDVSTPAVDGGVPAAVPAAGGGVTVPTSTDEVKAWQQANNLASDGIVGPLTEAAMRNAGFTDAEIAAARAAGVQINRVNVNTPSNPTLSLPFGLQPSSTTNINLGMTNLEYAFNSLIRQDLSKWDYNTFKSFWIPSSSVNFNLVDTRVIFSDQLTGRAVDNSITGNALSDVFSRVAGKGLTGGADPSWLMLFDLNSRLDNAVNAFLGDSGSWVFNPYKSKHYDGLCISATRFNYMKERQILCKRLGCLEKMAETGGPLQACDFEYSLDMCMYVDSARYKLEGNKVKILESLGRVAVNNIIGFTFMRLYLFGTLNPIQVPGINLGLDIWPGCVHYQIADPKTKEIRFSFKMPEIPGNPLNGMESVICGLTGTLFSLREMAAFANNPYSALKSQVPTELPATSPDFCSGVNYQ
ncbi:peptidoglycan-binding protein [Candidatus Woesearchaeota archaeon]|nr:peptidoglycan-binding protein [Candidatus Woesearchaeota archaeon]